MDQQTAPTQNDRRNVRPVGPTSAPAQAYWGESWAVVIGIERYADHDPAVNAENDAHEVARVLREDHGFTHMVELYSEQATGRAILTSIRNKLTSSDGPATNDRVIFYFAGHGAYQGDSEQSSSQSLRGYLVPYDAARDGYADYVAMAELLEACKLIRAKHILLILDCCCSGLSLLTYRHQAEAKMLPPLSELKLARWTQDKAWQLLTAGTGNELVRADSSYPGHSPFTGALLAALRGEADENGDNLMAFWELAVWVENKVLALVGAEHKPSFANLLGHGGGEFVFVVPGESPKFAPPTTMEVVRHQGWSSLRRYLVPGILLLLALVSLIGFLYYMWRFRVSENEKVQETVAAMQQGIATMIAQETRGQETSAAQMTAAAREMGTIAAQGVATARANQEAIAAAQTDAAAAVGASQATRSAARSELETVQVRGTADAVSAQATQTELVGQQQTIEATRVIGDQTRVAELATLAATVPETWTPIPATPTATLLPTWTPIPATLIRRTPTVPPSTSLKLRIRNLSKEGLLCSKIALYDAQGARWGELALATYADQVSQPEVVILASPRPDWIAFVGSPDGRCPWNALNMVDCGNLSRTTDANHIVVQGSELVLCFARDTGSRPYP